MGIIINNGLTVFCKNGKTETKRATIEIEKDVIKRISFGDEITSVKDNKNITVINAEDKIVIPGLINCHTHSHAVLSKGTFRNIPLEIASQLIAAGRTGMTEREIYIAALIEGIESLKTGGTTVLDQVEQGEKGIEAVIQAYRDVGIRAIVIPSIRNRRYYETIPWGDELVPKDIKKLQDSQPVPDSNEYLNMCKGLIGRWHGINGRIYIGLGPSTPFRCTEDLLLGCARMSNEYGVIIHTHLLETKVQSETQKFLYSKRMTEYLGDLNVLSPRLSFAHGVWVDSKDIEIISKYGASVIHNPLSNLVSGAGIAPVLKLLKGGVNVGLGTDSPNAGGNMSMFEPMRLVGSLHNLSDGDYRKWITPDQAFLMATQRGAKALNLDNDIGTLEVGKKADISILNMKSTPLIPINDLVFQLVYCENGNSVSTVIVEGKIVVREGKVLTIDENAIINEAIELGENLFSRNQPYFEFASKQEEYIRKIYAKVHGFNL